MDSASAFMVMVFVFVVWLAEALLFIRKGGGPPRAGPGYRAMMGLGIILILSGISGIVFSGELSVYLPIGAIFFALGFIFRNRPVRPLTKELKRLRTILVSVALLVMAAAVTAILLF
jgi:hypothetical protein